MASVIPFCTRKYLSCWSLGIFRRILPMNTRTSQAFSLFSSRLISILWVTDGLAASVSYSCGLFSGFVNVATCDSAHRLEKRFTTEILPFMISVVFCGVFGDSSVTPYRFGKNKALSCLNNRGFDLNVLPSLYFRFVHSRKYGFARCAVLSVLGVRSQFEFNNMVRSILQTHNSFRR